MQIIKRPTPKRRLLAVVIAVMVMTAVSAIVFGVTTLRQQPASTPAVEFCCDVMMRFG